MGSHKAGGVAGGGMPSAEAMDTVDDTTDVGVKARVAIAPAATPEPKEWQQ